MSDGPDESVMGYARAPVIESVIEFRFATPIPFGKIEDVHHKLRPSHPAAEVITEFGFEIPPKLVESGSDSMSVQKSNTGIKLTNSEGTEVFILSSSSVLFSRVAPYPGWIEVKRSAKEKWEICKSVIGYREIVRLGLRNVNRIDVPQPPVTKVSVAEYISFFVQYPDFFPAASMFALNLVWSGEPEEFVTTVNLGLAPSPLPNHFSFMFDIDVGRNTNVPQREDALWEMLETMRKQKNAVFEAGITEKTRDLFR